MSTIRLKEKISSLVNSQFPEFIRSDYTTFVAFVEAYYKFLEQDQGAQEIIQNARSYSDIDLTIESFVQYFLNQYAKDIPQSVLINKPLLVKRIRDIYESKGAELSYKLLFQILFDSSVSINYPFENVLIASDGRWEDSISVRVELTGGSVDDIANRYLKLEKNNRVYTTAVLRVKFLSGSLYEIFFDHNTLPPFLDGDVVSVSSSSAVIFTGVVKSTTNAYSILSPGTGFRRGQIFTVNVAGSVDTLVQVLGVNGTGGITRLKFLNYGYNFTEDVEVNLNADLSIATITQAKSSKTLGFIEDFSMYLGTTATNPDRYFDTNYVLDVTPFTGSLLVSSTLNTSYPAGSDVVDNSANIATILFKVGAVGRYPGSYTSNKGFLSEPDIRLQDDKLYQPFAYQTITDVDIGKFYDIVKKLIHPAGQQLYNNRTLTNSFDVSSNIAVISSANVSTELYSSIEPTDNVTFEISRYLTDTIAVGSNISLTLVKTISSVDNVTLSDSVGFNLGLNPLDDVNTTDEQFATIGKLIDDIAAITDYANLYVNFSINNTLSNVTLTESVTADIINYAEPGYFDETYSAETLILL
jgi:hypothetical protein